VRDHVAMLQQQINTFQLDLINMEGHLEDEHKRMNQKSRRSLDKLYTSKYRNCITLYNSLYLMYNYDLKGFTLLHVC